MQCQSSSHPSKWSEQKLNEWFESEQYLNGLQITPDPSINRRSFAEHYYDHKEVWDKALAFMKNSNLSELPLGRIELGDKMYATVSEYFLKERDTTLFEAHQIYIDIQYVISGRELIDVAPLETLNVTEPFNSEKDILFGTVPKYSALKASPDRFFIFFPSDAHRPGIKEGNDNVFTRKIVVKLPK
jgi:YhcH/YjgK/YiaL family protein